MIRLRNFLSLIAFALVGAALLGMPAVATAAFAVKIEYSTNNGGSYTMLDGNPVAAGTQAIYDRVTTPSQNPNSIDSNPFAGTIVYDQFGGHIALGISGLDLRVSAVTSTDTLSSQLNQVTSDAKYTKAVGGPDNVMIRISVTDQYSLPVEANKTLESITIVPGSSATTITTPPTFQSYVSAGTTEFDVSGITTGLQTVTSTENKILKNFNLSGGFTITSVMNFKIISGEKLTGLSGTSTVLAPAPNSAILALAALPIIGLGGLLRRRFRQNEAAPVCAVA